MGKKKSTSKEGDAAIVLNYLRKVNRPYSATDIFNNLHGKHQKNDIVKALEHLIGQDAVVSKMYGKMSIFSVKQNKEDMPSSEEYEAIGTEIEQLTKALDEIAQENLKLTHSLRTMTNAPTTEDARIMVAKIQQENDSHKQRLEKLRTGQVLMDKDEKTKIDKEFDLMRKEWRTRRKLFREVFGTITEHMPNKPSEFKEELGIEDDPIPYEQDPLSSSL